MKKDGFFSKELSGLLLYLIIVSTLVLLSLQINDLLVYITTFVVAAMLAGFGALILD